MVLRDARPSVHGGHRFEILDGWPSTNGPSRDARCFSVFRGASWLHEFSRRKFDLLAAQLEASRSFKFAGRSSIWANASTCDVDCPALAGSRASTGYGRRRPVFRRNRDQRQIEQILVNLLMNASKYGKDQIPGSRIGSRRVGKHIEWRFVTRGREFHKSRTEFLVGVRAKGSTADLKGQRSRPRVALD